MYYYKVNMVGDGSEDNPKRPNIPEGVSFVWSDVPCPSCGMYILASNTSLNLEPITNLEESCNLRGLNYNEVSAWMVGN